MRENVPLAAPELIAAGPGAPLSPGTGLGEPAWEAFYALVWVAGTLLVEAASLTTAPRVAASLALAAMIPWYWFLARPVMRMEEKGTWEQAVTSWRGPAYLTGLIALFAVALYANPNAWFLAFAFSPQCFQVVPVRRAMAFVIGLNVVAGLMLVLPRPSVESAATAAATILFAVGFTWVFSRWTVRVIEQSHERAALLAQLEAAQEELAEVNHEAGALAERQRLAAEIHDTLAQGFLSIVTLIQAAQVTRVAADPASEHLELALATARENLAEARALIAALAPASLDDGGLPGAVARAAEVAGRAAGIGVTCASEGAVRPLPTVTEVVLLRVCQEALANVRRHAAATRAEVRLSYTAATVELSVADDGRGFALAGQSGPPGGGFGLRGMRERLRQAGGTLSVTTAPGAGTTVRAEIPA
ncbi:MAG TPA: sensor histidine kinase [Trebonia sp.]